MSAEFQCVCFARKFVSAECGDLPLLTRKAPGPCVQEFATPARRARMALLVSNPEGEAGIARMALSRRPGQDS